MKTRYYYLQVPGCADGLCCGALAKALSSNFFVRDFGTGASSDKSAAWFEISTSHETIVDLRSELNRLLVGPLPRTSTIVIVPITKGEGRVQSKQLGLFRGEEEQ